MDELDEDLAKVVTRSPSRVHHEKSRKGPAWLSTTMFASTTLLTTSDSYDKPDCSTIEYSSDGDSSDDGLGEYSEFISGRFASREPRMSDARFGLTKTHRSASVSTHHKDEETNNGGNDDDDDDNDDNDDLVEQAECVPGLERWNSSESLTKLEEHVSDPITEVQPIPDAVPAEVKLEMGGDIVKLTTTRLLTLQSMFVKCLRCVERSYINLARASIALSRKPRMLNDSEQMAIFVNWRDIATINVEMKRAMRICRHTHAEDETAVLTSILQTICNHVSAYSRIYLIYASENTFSIRSLEGIMRRRETFADLRELNERCDNAKLDFQLAQPLVYFKEVLEVVTGLSLGAASMEATPLGVLCQRSRLLLAKLANDIDYEVNLSEARSRVIGIQEKLFAGQVNLVQPGRYCVRYGPLQKLTSANKKDGKIYTFFMFDDLLLAADGRSGQMRVKYVLDLQDMKVTPPSAGSYSFHIESTVKSLLLSAQTEDIAASWAADLQYHVNNLSQRRSPHNVRNPFQLDSFVRDESARLHFTVDSSVEESHEILASKKEGTMSSVNTLAEPSTPSTALASGMESSEDGEAFEPVSRNTLSAPSTLASAFKIQLTSASDPRASTASTMSMQLLSQSTGSGNCFGQSMQGYLQIKGIAFGSLTSMFFVLNSDKAELDLWKLKAEALRTISHPKKVIQLKDAVAFPYDYPDGAGFELFTASSKRAQVMIAPDVVAREAWCDAINKFKSPDRVIESWFEKRGGEQGNKPWRKRYFVMVRSSRVILYFTKRQDAGGSEWQLNANGSIDVHDCTVRLVDVDEAQAKLGRASVIEVTPASTQRRFYLSQNDPAELARWINEIKRLVIGS